MTEIPKPDIQVILSYKQLEELLEAAKEVRQLRIEVKRLRDQQSSLRYQFIELMEKLSSQ